MKRRSEQGFALLGVLMLSFLLSALVAGYFSLTRVDMSTTDASMDSVRGFYAAEAGSNVRAELVRQTFEGYNRPTGGSPDDDGEPCAEGNFGSGDFACTFYGFQDRQVMTYVEEAAGNPSQIVIPRGEQFQNLSAQEYRYLVRSESQGPDERTEAMLELAFKSRLVPMFQFAAFYNKDLEILPGPAMTLAGPVHTNGDLYVGANTGLGVLGQVTSVGDLYNGRKDYDDCMNAPVEVIDPDNLSAIPACSGTRRQITPAETEPWNDMILMHVDELVVPPPEVLDPTPGEIYWDKADLRVMLDLNPDPPQIQIRNADGSVNVLDSGTLDGCGSASHSSGFKNNREDKFVQMLDVNVRDLLDCIHANQLMGPSKPLNETSEGGLVWYLGVDGPDSNVANNYGVRVHNGGLLRSTDVTAPIIKGLTVVTNQAIYIQGNYNAAQKKPASFLADSLNILSNAWTDDAHSELDLYDDNREASSTNINAAFLAGTDTTGASPGDGDDPEDYEGPAGQSQGTYNGGLENYPRFHEDWSGHTLRYRGSFVSLNNPRHVVGEWVYGGSQYEAPDRDWGFDSMFENADSLPPLSPRFVYLRQELFVRDFDM